MGWRTDGSPESDNDLHTFCISWMWTSLHSIIRTLLMPAVKRLAGVAAEVDLREWTLHLLWKEQVNKAETTLALKLRGDVTRNPKQGYQLTQNRTPQKIVSSEPNWPLVLSVLHPIKHIFSERNLNLVFALPPYSLPILRLWFADIGSLS